ncbi:MAG: hypothetical protein AVDCRST_MAG88-3453, partial [uncultured Thermomicrobiales bacterium]
GCLPAVDPSWQGGQTSPRPQHLPARQERVDPPGPAGLVSQVLEPV